MSLNRKTSAICYGTTALILTIILAWGICGNIIGHEMGYSILAFYLIMPITFFVTSLILGLRKAYLKWVCPVLFGAAGYIIPLMVFGATDTIVLLFSFIPALLGLGMGVLIEKARFKKEHQ